MNQQERSGEDKVFSMEVRINITTKYKKEKQKYKNKIYIKGSEQSEKDKTKIFVSNTSQFQEHIQLKHDDKIQGKTQKIKKHGDVHHCKQQRIMDNQ